MRLRLPFSWILLTLALLDAFLLLRLRIVQRDLDGAQLVGTRIPLHRSHAGGHGCEVIHYVSSGCHFCVPPRSGGWLMFEARAVRAGCRVVELSPAGLDFPLDGDRTPHASPLWASPAFAARTHFSRTPTTLACAPDGTVVWERVGALRGSDEAAAAHRRALYRRWGWLGLEVAADLAPGRGR